MILDLLFALIEDVLPAPHLPCQLKLFETWVRSFVASTLASSGMEVCRRERGCIPLQRGTSLRIAEVRKLARRTPRSRTTGTERRERRRARSLKRRVDAAVALSFFCFVWHFGLIVC